MSGVNVRYTRIKNKRNIQWKLLTEISLALKAPTVGYLSIGNESVLNAADTTGTVVVPLAGRFQC